MALRRLTPFAAAVGVGLLVLSTPVVAEAAVMRGLFRVIGGIFQIPMGLLAGTFNGPPIIGTLMGAVNGTFSGVGNVLGGTLELAGDAFALAKAVAPYLLPFLL